MLGDRANACGASILLCRVREGGECAVQARRASQLASEVGTRWMLARAATRLPNLASPIRHLQCWSEHEAVSLFIIATYLHMNPRVPNDGIVYGVATVQQYLGVGG